MPQDGPKYRLQVVGRDPKIAQARDSAVERARKVWGDSYQRDSETGQRVAALLGISEQLRDTDIDAAMEAARKAELLSKELSPGMTRVDVDKSMADQERYGGAADALIGPLAQGALSLSGQAPWWIKAAELLDTLKPQETQETQEAVVPRGGNREKFIQEFLRKRGITEVDPKYVHGLSKSEPETYQWYKGAPGQASQSHTDRVKDLEAYAKLRWPRVMGDTEAHAVSKIGEHGRYVSAGRRRPPRIEVGEPGYGPLASQEEKLLFANDPRGFRQQIDDTFGHELRHRGQEIRAKGEVPAAKDYKYREEDFGYWNNPYEVQAREYSLPFREGYDEFENEVRKYLRGN